MNLPIVISDLVKAQNNFDSTAYANCFNETAVVFDEGKTHKGKKEIKNWIEKAQKVYQVTMKPLEYSETEQALEAEISGNFPGSPLVLSYKFEFKEEQIQSLKIV
tara:strand:- start:8026 stop:8340 length:315 start_codon:yes stop_codon:yes gene_type:complete